MDSSEWLWFILCIRDIFNYFSLQVCVWIEWEGGVRSTSGGWMPKTAPTSASPSPLQPKNHVSCFFVAFFFFSFKISLSNNVCITWALEKALTLLVNMMGHKAVKWIPLRNMARALLSTSKDEIDVAQYDHILGKHCCLKLSHTTVHLYSFTPSVLLSISLSVSSPS